MKTIRLKNFNNKFACDYFGLIAPAPSEKIPGEQIIKPFIVEDHDGNYPNFKVERITMLRFFLWEIPEVLSHTANACDPTTLRDELIQEYNCGQEQEFAYYLFKKNTVPMTEKQFIQKIAKAAEAKNITKYKMGKEGVNGQLFRRAIEGKGTLTLPNALKLCKIVGVEVTLK